MHGEQIVVAAKDDEVVDAVPIGIGASGSGDRAVPARNVFGVGATRCGSHGDLDLRRRGLVDTIGHEGVSFEHDGLAVTGPARMEEPPRPDVSSTMVRTAPEPTLSERIALRDVVAPSLVSATMNAISLPFGDHAPSCNE